MTSQDAHLLIVDDDERIRSLLQKFLIRQGFFVSAARDAAHARRILAGLDFDLIVLDVMMPGEDGVTFTQSLRETVETPILLLTARGEPDDRITGLEAGADDYLAKPFEPAELTARVRALLRRTEAAHADEVLSFGELQIRVQARTVHAAQTHVPLSPREFDLLVYFARNHGNVVTRMQLLEHVWNLHFDPQTNVVDVHVGRLRRKLEAALGHSVIRTERGQGYVFAPDPDGLS